MYQVSTIVQVGNGARTLFWSDKWIEGKSIEELAPLVWAAVPKRTRNTRLVRDALVGTIWARDVTGSLSVPALRQYLHLWYRLQRINIDQNQEDKFIWKWTQNQQYSASSAYRAFFIGQCGVPGAKELTKTRATPRCKFFFWHVFLGRCWSSERLQRQNLQNNGPCALCSQQPETLQHLLLSCPFSREVWFRLLRTPGL